jgi:hypothetical protein
MVDTVKPDPYAPPTGWWIVAHRVGRCPACGAALAVRRLECADCGTAVEGHFTASPYAALSPDQEAFLELFLRARGNLREAERVLGLSYPTVRARLDGVLEALGFGTPGTAGPPAAPLDAEQVLGALERGEITAAEAAHRLRGL